APGGLGTAKRQGLTPLGRSPPVCLLPREQTDRATHVHPLRDDKLRATRDTMKLTVVGCGDAFGSGGRLQTCYHVETAHTRFLIDCGATTLVGFSKLGLDPNAVETIFISHLHGDHFAGLVWWLIHAQPVAKRTA